MRYTVRKSIVYVLGTIWQPGCGTCSYRYTLPERHGLVTQSDVRAWIDTNAGDFQSITDFAASLEVGKRTIEIPFSLPDSEQIYQECAL